jgi:hypothetical protein
MSDADLVAVKQDVSLVANYDRARYAWLWLPAMGAVAIAAGGYAAVRAARGRKRAVAARFRADGGHTFHRAGVARDIQCNNGLRPSDNKNLSRRSTVWRHHFQSPEQPDKPPRDRHVVGLANRQPELVEPAAAELGAMLTLRESATILVPLRQSGHQC